MRTAMMEFPPQPPTVGVVPQSSLPPTVAPQPIVQLPIVVPPSFARQTPPPPPPAVVVPARVPMLAQAPVLAQAPMSSPNQIPQDATQKEDPEVIAAEMEKSTQALLDLEIPSCAELAMKLSPNALARLVVALTVELKRAHAKACQAEELTSRLNALAGQVLNQKAASAKTAVQQQQQQQQQPEKENWAWSTGHKTQSEEKEKDKDRDRDRRSRSRRRRRSRSNKREKDKSPEREARERDRAFVAERAKRATQDAVQQRARLGADIEESWGKFRASCTFMGDRGPVTSVGPWRKTSDKALQDAEEFAEAYRRGGDGEVQKAKVSLLKRATAEGGKDDDDPATSSAHLCMPQDGRFSYPTEVEGPSKTSSSLGGYRACVTFPNLAKPTYEGARPRKPIPVKCPWRLGPRAKASAEQDAEQLCRAYETRGEQGMQDRKKEMFRTADADAKAARMGRGKDDTLTNIFQKSSSALPDADESEDAAAKTVAETLRHGIEEDKVRGSNSRGVRAKCVFPGERPNYSGNGSAPVEISGPWRRRRSEVESDIEELQAAFSEGGLRAANAKRMAMLREREEGPQSEDVPKGELTEDDLAKRYGKGYKLALGMGLSAGSGLGPEGLGQKTPVEAVDAEIALATASRHIGLGFADVAGLGAPSNE